MSVFLLLIIIKIYVEKNKEKRKEGKNSSERNHYIAGRLQNNGFNSFLNGRFD